MPIKFKLIVFLYIALIAISLTCTAQNASNIMEFPVNGTIRKALVYLPKNSEQKPIPIIFAFHGHGGTMANLYKTRRFDLLWPEAIFVCPQGLNTPGKLTDPKGKKTGWQMDAQESNSDLQFFDEILKTLKDNYKIDTQRIFVTGHSNGGGFTYLLWTTRADLIRAVAPTACIAGKLLPKLTPKPAFHLVGEKDPLVKPQWQKITYTTVMKLNECNLPAIKIDSLTTLYPSVSGNPFTLFSHSGGHEYPASANEAIIRFFKGIK